MGCPRDQRRRAAPARRRPTPRRRRGSRVFVALVVFDSRRSAEVRLARQTAPRTETRLFTIESVRSPRGKSGMTEAPSLSRRSAVSGALRRVRARWRAPIVGLSAVGAGRGLDSLRAPRVHAVLVCRPRPVVARPMRRAQPVADVAMGETVTVTTTICRLPQGLGAAPNGVPAPVRGSGGNRTDGLGDHRHAGAPTRVPAEFFSLFARAWKPSRRVASCCRRRRLPPPGSGPVSALPTSTRWVT